MKKDISPDAFAAPLLKTITIESSSPSLKERFQTEYKDRIHELYLEFLDDVLIEQLAKTRPLLLQSIDDSPLSTRSKNCLKATGAERMADVILFSPTELRLFRNMGPKSLAEIEAYIYNELLMVKQIRYL